VSETTPPVDREGTLTLRIGTRGSQLALWQANTVSALLTAAHPDVTCELVTIKTTGDRLGEAALSEEGGKRLFVKEIEEALIDGRVDLAVHSAKDMPADSPASLTVGAVLAREEPWDAIVLPARRSPPSHPPSPPLLLEGGEGGIAATGTLEQILSHVAAQAGGACTVGTSSVRRVAQLRRLLRGATFAPIRGNLDTRLRKLDEGQYDLLVLAAAGLKRLGAGDRISARLPLEACVPAPGQGIVAVQVRGDDEVTMRRVEAIDDHTAGAALVAERMVIEALGGGCSVPLGAIAIPFEDTLDLHAIVLSLDGDRAIRAQASGGIDDAAALGERAAESLIAQGARELLAQIPLKR
jgi:hydroxymethylbilane synthase